MNASRLLRLTRAAAAGVALVGLVAAVTTSAHAASRESAASQDWFDRMAAYFDRNPELKTTPGSGWNPYNRQRWFTEQRMLNGELPSATARWDAWQVKQQRSLGNPSRAVAWFSLGPNNLAGRMLAVAFDPTTPTTAYAGGADGGVWKSTNSASSWFPISDELPSLAVGGIAVSLTNPNIIVIGTGEATNNIDRVGGVGILRSTNAGSTWETTSLSLGASSGHGFHVVTAGPNGTFLAGATDGLYRSTDDGANWTQVLVGDDYYDVVWRPGHADSVYCIKGNAQIGNNVKLSTDDGITWVKRANGFPSTFTVGKSKLAVTASNPDVLYALVGDPNGNAITGVYKTTDGLASWNTQSTQTTLLGGQIWYNLALAVDPDNEAVVIAGGVSLQRSTNSGVGWGGVGGVHTDHHCAAYMPGSSNTLLLGGDGGMYLSTNDGLSFSYASTDLVTYQFYDICVNNGPLPYYVLGGTQDNGTDKWSGTTTWANGLGADGMVCNVAAVSGTKVYAETQLGNHQRNLTSGIGSYTAINTGLTGSGAWVAPFDVDFNLGAHCYTATSAGIFRSANSGTNWTNVAAHNAVWISISPVNGDVVWTTTGSTFVTTDDGGTWASTTPFPFPTGGATKIHAHPNDVASAIVVFGSYSSTVSHMALTTDYGVSWTDVTGDFPGLPCNAVAINPSDDSQWFVGTDVGVWLSEDGGAHWAPFDSGLPNVVVSDLEIQDSLQKVVAGTHGRGAWEADLPVAGVVAAPTSVDVARNLMLDAPFPNPVRDRTMFRFAARHDGPVTLDIFDVQGRLVSSLGELSTGDGLIRTTPWFTDDVPSGVYFAVLRAGEITKTRKVVVAK